MLKDQSGYDYNSLNSRIASIQGSKDYLLSGGAFWEFDMKAFVRMSQEEKEDKIRASLSLRYAEMIMGRLEGANFKVRKRFLKMRRYVNFLSPIAFKEVNFSRTNEFQPFTTEGVTNLFPLVVSSDFGQMGDVYGIDIVTQLPVVIDRFSQSSYHMCVIGETGSGKSFFVKMGMLRYLLRDNQVKVFILDPLGEYLGIARKLGGTVVDMTENVINPLDIRTTASEAFPRGDVKDKVNRVLTMLNIYFKGLSDQMLSVISSALTKQYMESPLDVTFETLVNEIKKRPNYDSDGNAQMAVASLDIFVNGSLRNLNQPTNVPLGKDMIVFDLHKGMNEHMKQFYLFFITDFLYGEVSKDMERKLVYIDEARHFMMYKETASFINNFVMHARHYNCGVTLITQNISDFYTEEGGNFSVSTLNNAYSVVVFTNNEIPKKFIEAYNLTDDEVNYIRQSTGLRPAPGGGKVSYCLLVQKNRKYRMVVVGLPLEAQLAETNPNASKSA
jgi:hypothetical protein